MKLAKMSKLQRRSRSKRLGVEYLFTINQEIVSLTIDNYIVSMDKIIVVQSIHIKVCSPNASLLRLECLFAEKSKKECIWFI